MTLPELKAKLDVYERLMRLDKPIGILLLLWPTLWALWAVSWGQPPLMALWIFILGTVLMRSAGCVINDYADRDFDGHVERTKNRPMATGAVSKREALLLAGGLSLVAWLLSVPAILLAASYPFTKRFFAVPQAYLGVAFGFGIPMAYATFLETVPWGAWLLLAANVFWCIAYDTEYAMVDREDDLKIGIKTSAITFGRFDIVAVMLCYAIALGLLVCFGRVMHYGYFFYIGLAVAAAIAVYHYFLIRGRERDKCFKAFLHNTWFGAAVFAGFVAELNLKGML
jgi:4-hydroxybenzoate polyprenyltransferase